MKKIKEELQENEDYYPDGYQLKTNDQIINDISEFGNGVMEFHSLDANRLVVENERAKELVDHFLKLKLEHEMPNDNKVDYNRGYVKCCNDIINALGSIF